MEIGMLQFSFEPNFKPLLFRTGPRFGPRFSKSTKLDHKSGSTFRQGRFLRIVVECSSNWNFCKHWTNHYHFQSLLLDYVAQIVTLVTSEASTVLSYIIYCCQPLHQVHDYVSSFLILLFIFYSVLLVVDLSWLAFSLSVWTLRLFTHFWPPLWFLNPNMYSSTNNTHFGPFPLSTPSTTVISCFQQISPIFEPHPMFLLNNTCFQLTLSPKGHLNVSPLTVGCFWELDHFSGHLHLF